MCVTVPRWMFLCGGYSDWPGIVSDKAHTEITIDPQASCFLLHPQHKADQTDPDRTDTGWDGPREAGTTHKGPKSHRSEGPG